ncbi:MAG: M15 family metallopeptidase [Lachnospiraceae bacterium]
MRKKSCLFILCLLLLTGCSSPFVITDEEYYKTHTGTTEESAFSQYEKSTDEDQDDESDVDITACDLRTGIDAQAYTDASSSDKAEVIPADEVLPILAEEQGYFKVSYQDREMWVSEAYCLINAKQYIPSIQVNLGMGNNPNYFNIGDQSIPGVTDQLFYKRSGSQDGSEAWMRYGVAKQLRSAQKIFMKDGYTIKIYDAYRPHSVTIAIRDGYGAFLKTDEGKKLKQEYYYNGYGEGHFLAQKVSAHNYGVAIDMTLVEVDSNEEISMPSPMHTLDARSGLKSWTDKGTTETSHAQYMKGIMEAYGFSSLESEWWHFQVDTIARTLFDVPN